MWYYQLVCNAVWYNQFLSILRVAPPVADNLPPAGFVTDAGRNAGSGSVSRHILLHVLHYCTFMYKSLYNDAAASRWRDKW